MTDKEKLEKIVRLADAMYYAAQYLTTDASRLHKAMEEYHQFIINEYFKEEPVNKDRFAFKALPRLLEMIEPTDRAKTYISKLSDALEKEGYTTDAKIVRESIKIMDGEKVAMATMDEEPVSEDLELAATKYAQDKYMPVQTSQAFKAGAQCQKQQMIKDAIDAHCFGLQGDALFSFRLPASKYLVGSEVKVIVIKED